jgi:propionate CoA-transferase
VFSGLFNAGAKLALTDGQIVIDKDGKVPKIVAQVDQVSFSGKRARAQGQDVTYVTERCVMKLGPKGLIVTEIAPGIDLRRDILGQAATQLAVSPDLKMMDAALFQPGLTGLTLRPADARF